MMKSDNFNKSIVELMLVILPELIGFLGFIIFWQLLAMQYSEIILPSPHIPSPSREPAFWKLVLLGKSQSEDDF